MRSLLVVTGGHPFEADPFAEMLGSLAGWKVKHLQHPEAEAAIADGAADNAEGLLFYDMPGYVFADGAVTTRPPSQAFVAAIERRLASGRGAVMMHHALAGWADWPAWSGIVGGSFLYQSGSYKRQQRLDSGYRHDVSYTGQIVADHPVTAGLPATFPVNDELYLAQIDETDVIPLVRADHAFVADNFYSAAHAVAGRMFENADWPHPPGSNLVAWARHHGPAPIVYLQFGDGPPTYANPVVRQMLANALDWTANSQETS